MSVKLDSCLPSWASCFGLSAFMKKLQVWESVFMSKWVYVGEVLSFLAISNGSFV